MGPVTAADGLKKYEIYWTDIKQSSDRHSDRYLEYLKPFFDRLPLYTGRRLTG